MEGVLIRLGGYAALGLEAAAVLLVLVGGVEAFYGIVKAAPGGPPGIRSKKDVWVGFGVWILLGLEFELAADIVRSVITKTWADIGRLAAIAVIRTFVNYFLEQDVEKYAVASRTARAVPSAGERADAQP